MLPHSQRMKTQIVPSGLVTREAWRRPKARFFGFVSVVWLVLAFICLPLVLALDEKGEFPDIDRFAWFLVLPSALLIMLTIFFWLTERPRRVVEHAPTDRSGPIIH